MRKVRTMKVFLIIVRIIIISEVLDLILKVIDSTLGKKKLRLENELLKTQLDTANETIKHKNKVIFVKILRIGANYIKSGYLRKM